MNQPRWVFATPTLSRPTGGDIALFELASALARQGAGGVHLVHLPFRGDRTRRLSDLPWAEIHPDVEHTFADTLSPDALPHGDVLVYTMKLVASAHGPHAERGGAQLLEALGRRDPRWAAPPVLFLQGLGVFGDEVEDLALRLPGLKACVSTWLARRAEEGGAAADSIACIPNGVDPRTFAVRQPIEARSALVAMNYDPHPVKRGDEGMVALGEVHRSLGVPATAFGTRAPEDPPPPGVRFVASPSRFDLVDGIYNRATLFLQPSRQEGFGMCAVEAMACGCALVTTANGGSDDFAHHEETALVCDPDPTDMAAALGRLVRDDELRMRLARSGARFVERFRWASSAERLERFVAERSASPQ